MFTDAELDVIEHVQEMRENNGELDMGPLALFPSHQRSFERDLVEMRRFGYAFLVGRDAVGRIVRVKLLDH